MPFTKKKRGKRRSSNKHRKQNINRNKNTFRRCNKIHRHKHRRSYKQKGGWSWPWPFSKKTEIPPNTNDDNNDIGFSYDNTFYRNKYERDTMHDQLDDPVAKALAAKCKIPLSTYQDDSKTAHDVNDQYNACCPKSMFGFKKNTSTYCQDLDKIYKIKLDKEQIAANNYAATPIYNTSGSIVGKYDPRDIDQSPKTDIYTLHNHYNKWCPKTRFGFKNTSNYCQTLNKTIQDRIKMETDTICNMPAYKVKENGQPFANNYYTECCVKRKGNTKPGYCESVRQIIKPTLPTQPLLNEDQGEPDLDA